MNVKNDDSTCSFDMYALFQGVDKSILELNPIIEPMGYRFIPVSFLELEKKFSSVFHLKNKSSKPSQENVSAEFKTAFSLSSIKGLYDLDDDTGVLLLQKIFFDKKYTNKAKKSMEEFVEFQNFLNELVRKLRLLSGGYIAYSALFSIDKKNRNFSRLYEKGTKPPHVNKVDYYKVNVDFIGKNIKNDFESTELTELAEQYFELSYNRHDTKINISLLMMALESLLNQGTNQIAHTISRHLSIIVSEDEKMFQENYEYIKKKYSLRSKIMHGDKVKPHIDLHQEYLDLQDLVRKAIIYCINSKKNKEELFNSLNSAGFNQK